MDYVTRGGELKRRKRGNNKKSKNRVDSKHGGGAPKVKKIDGKMKRLFRKRAREYNSDDDDDNDDQNLNRQDDRGIYIPGREKKSQEAADVDDNSDNSADVSSNGSGEDDDGNSDDDQVTAKLNDGSNAFKAAFRSIMANSVTDDGLGPVLSAQRKLVAEKLAEEEVEKKVSSEAKKEKQLVKEKGHVNPASYLDACDKFLIGVATKGVVKLFNAVNKAQHAQKGLNPLRSKDEKEFCIHNNLLIISPDTDKYGPKQFLAKLVVEVLLHQSPVFVSQFFPFSFLRHMVMRRHVIILMSIISM